jgi:hypothetical protein
MATQLQAWCSRAGSLNGQRVGFVVVLGLLIVAGLALRLLAARPGFLGDELFTYAIAERNSLAGVMDGVRTTENTPPLYYVLAWLSVKATAVPELARLPSLIAGTALIPVAALVGRRAFGARAGLVAAALMAISPFAIYYSSEARSYAPAALCVLLSTLLLLRALATDRTHDWAGLAVAAAAAVWFHYTAVFPLALQFAWALFGFPGSRRPLLVAHIAAAALYAPWLPFAGAYVPLSEVSRFIDIFAPLAPARSLEYAARALVGHPVSPLTEAPGEVALVGLAALAVAAAVVGIRRAWRPRWADPAVVLVLGALAAPGGILLVSLVESNIYLPRNLFVSAPAALVLISGAAAAVRPAAALAGAVAAVVLLMPSAVSLATGEHARPAYDDVARLVDERARPSDPVIEAPLFPGERSLAAPLRRALLSFLTEPHAIYLGDYPEPGWRAAERTGRAFVVYPTTPEQIEVFDAGPDLTPPRGSALRAVDRRVYEGTPPLVYVEYERRR